MRTKLIQIIMFVWMVVAPIRPAMSAVFLLPVVDLILALVAAYRAKRPITSAQLKRTIAKVLCYEAATILAFIVEMYLTGPMIPAIRMVTGLVGVTELKSCLEHLDELGGQPLFVTILTKLAPKHPPEDQ